MAPQKVAVPAYFPDTPEVRSDILDHNVEVQKFDKQAADILAALTR